jgi:hypothetical protein
MLTFLPQKPSRCNFKLWISPERQNQILLSLLISSYFPTFLRRTSGQSLGVFPLVMQLSLSGTNCLSPISHYLPFPATFYKLSLSILSLPSLSIHLLQIVSLHSLATFPFHPSSTNCLSPFSHYFPFPSTFYNSYRSPFTFQHKMLLYSTCGFPLFSRLNLQHILKRWHVINMSVSFHYTVNTLRNIWAG